MNTKLIQNGLRLAIVRLLDDCLESESESIGATVPALLGVCIAQAELSGIIPDYALLEAFQPGDYIVFPRAAPSLLFDQISEWEWSKRLASVFRQMGVESCHISISPRLGKNSHLPTFWVEIKAEGLPSSSYPVYSPKERYLAVRSAGVIAIALNYLGFKVDMTLLGESQLDVYFNYLNRDAKPKIEPGVFMVTPEMVGGSYASNARDWAFSTLKTIGFDNHRDEAVRVIMIPLKSLDERTPDARLSWQITMYNSKAAYVLEIVNQTQELAFEMASSVAIAVNMCGFELDEKQILQWSDQSETYLSVYLDTFPRATEKKVKCLHTRS